MALTERTKLYSEIEKKTGNPLIVYATSRRQNASGVIGADVIEEFIWQLEKLDKPVKTLDILVESNGGDGLVVWRLISVLRTKTERIRVLVPNSAFSAATLFCLGADEIVMGKYGCLGPTDPQISAMGKDGQPKFFAFEDVLAFIDFASKKLALRSGEAKEIYNRLFDSIEPFALGFASRSSELSTSMGAKLLQFRSKNNLNSKQARRIAEKLNKNFFNHGHPLNKNEAKEIGLSVVDPDLELEKLMWKIHLDLEKEFLNDLPFDILLNYLKNNPPLIPGGNQIPVAEYPFDLKFSILESVRTNQEYLMKCKTTVFRNAQTLAYVPTNVVIEQGWKRH